MVGTDIPVKPHLLNLRQVADLFNVKPRTVNQWVRRGKIRITHRTPGGDPRISAEEIMRYMATVARSSM